MPSRDAPPPRGLLAVDLDGTLVRRDGTIRAEDLAAIARARRAGAVVTIATGRLVPTTLGTARALGLDVPLVCADGAALACPRTGAILETTPIAPAAIRLLLHVLRRHALAPFLCSADRILGDAAGGTFTAAVATLAPGLCLRDRIHAGACGGGVVMALALGPACVVSAALAAAERAIGDRVALASYPFGEGGPATLRAQPSGASKGAALARLAARLGVPRERVAAVGDGLNDVSMLAWAGASYAMGHAPDAVRGAAGCVLGATMESGGGVAEAVERWLA